MADSKLYPLAEYKYNTFSNETVRPNRRCSSLKQSNTDDTHPLSEKEEGKR